MRLGQPVLTPDGPGILPHPEIPGHPECAWWILFGRFAKRFKVNEIGEPSGPEVNTDIDVDIGGYIE